MNLLYIEKQLKKEINKSKKNNEVPVAALIVKDDKIIGKGHNKVNKNNSILNHAEILAIKKASRKIKNWRLNDCDMYVTLEPCDMCREIIKKARINKVYYYSKQNNNKTELNPTYKYIENNDNFSEELKKFFKEKR